MISRGFSGQAAAAILPMAVGVRLHEIRVKAKGSAAAATMLKIVGREASAPVDTPDEEP